MVGGRRGLEREREWEWFKAKTPLQFSQGENEKSNSPSDFKSTEYGLEGV